MVEKCVNCQQVLKENRAVRKHLLATNEEFVEVVNETLALRRYIATLTGDSNPILDTS